MSGRLRERYDSAEGTIRHNPARSVAVVFSIGLVVGLIVGLTVRHR